MLERPGTIAVVTEAVDALVRMLAPFAPHTGEELWEMLGHTGRSVRIQLAGASMPRLRRPMKIVVPVQINGKVRSRLTVPAETTEAELEARRARRSGGASTHSGQDDPEGRRGERQACLDRGLAARRSSVSSRWRVASSGCGYALAGRGSFLPDYIRVVGIPAFENRSSFSQVEQVLTEKVRIEFIGRGKYQRHSRRQLVSDAVLVRGDPRHLGPACRLQRTATGIELPLHLDDEGGVYGCADERGAVVERCADVPR